MDLALAMMSKAHLDRVGVACSVKRTGVAAYAVVWKLPPAACGEAWHAYAVEGVLLQAGGEPAASAYSEDAMYYVRERKGFSTGDPSCDGGVFEH